MFVFPFSSDFLIHKPPAQDPTFALSRAPSTAASAPVLSRPGLPMLVPYDELRPSSSTAGQKRKNGNEPGGPRKKRRTSDEVAKEKVKQRMESPKFGLTSAQGGTGNCKAEPAAQKGREGSHQAASQGEYDIPDSRCDLYWRFRRLKNGRNGSKKQKRRPTSCMQKLTRWSQTRRQL